MAETNLSYKPASVCSKRACSTDDFGGLGGVTGAAQQAGNVARFLTPSASAWLVAWANASPYRFPLDHTLPFTLFGVAWLAPLYFNLRLKEADVTA